MKQEYAKGKARAGVKSPMGDAFGIARRLWIAVQLLLLGLLATDLAGAEPVKGLYRAEVLVTSQSLRERNRASSEALAEVLVRVTGMPQVLQQPPAKSAIKRAQRYVSEFSYETTDEVLEKNGKAKAATRLVFRFSPALIDKLLRDARLPIWPANRPNLLVWLVEDDLRLGRQLVGGEEVLASLQQAAKRRGVPLATPLLDLQDRVALKPDDLWQLNEDKIRAASRRYRADGILVGRYTQTSDGRWRANWQLLLRQDASLFESSADAVEAVIERGIDRVADYLAGLYAIVPRGQGPATVVVQIDGVRDFRHYIATLNYFDGLAMVRDAAPTQVNGETLVLQLHAEGDLSLLLQTLALDKKLLPADNGGSLSLPGSRYSPRGSLANPLQYRWAADQ